MESMRAGWTLLGLTTTGIVVGAGAAAAGNETLRDGAWIGHRDQAQALETRGIWLETAGPVPITVSRYHPRTLQTQDGEP